MDRMNRLTLPAPWPPSPGPDLLPSRWRVSPARAAPHPRRQPASANAWAIVNGREIKRTTSRRPIAAPRRTNAAPSEEELATAKLGILNELIVQDMLLAKARELKIELADTEIDKAFEEGKKNITPEAFEKSLAARNLTTADMREALRRDMLAQKVVEQEVTKKVVVTDQEVTDFFNANKAQFNRPEDAYHIAQIAVTPVPDQEIANRIGRRCEDAARGGGQDPDADGAAEGRASRSATSPRTSRKTRSRRRAAATWASSRCRACSRRPPALRDAVLKSEPGSVRVVSNAGAHTIVLFVAKDTAGQKDPSMPAVKDAITSALRGRREQLLRAAYLTAIRNDATVVNILANRLVDAEGQGPAGGTRGGEVTRFAFRTRRGGSSDPPLSLSLP